MNPYSSDRKARVGSLPAKPFPFQIPIDPTTEAFTTLPVNLSHHAVAATLLENGKVLLQEGSSGCDKVTGTITRHPAELLDPVSLTVTRVNVYGGTSATRLQDGRVLIKGLQGCGRGALFRNVFMADLPNTYIFDPETELVSETASSYQNYGIAPPTSPALMLEDGRVFFSGWLGGYVQMTEVYDPKLETWRTPYGILDGHHFSQYTAPIVEQDGGTVLVADFLAKAAFTYDLQTEAFTGEQTPLNYYHGSSPSIALLTNGKTLVVGGDGAEYFNP